MNRSPIPLNKAIEEAIRLGFNTRFVEVNGKIRSVVSEKTFKENNYAIVKSYPVVAPGYNGKINYIVFNDGKLGFFLKGKTNMPDISSLYAEDKDGQYEDIPHIEEIEENEI